MKCGFLNHADCVCESPLRGMCVESFFNGNGVFSFQRWRWCPKVPPVETLLVSGLISPQSGSRGNEDLMHGSAVDATHGGHATTGCNVGQQQLFV